jgi:hypothetical protein
MNCKYYVNEDSFELFLSVYLLSLHVVLFLLSGCNLFDIWIPEVVEDLLSSFPSFMVHHLDIFFFLVWMYFDLWIPEAVEDMLSSFPSFMVHSETCCFYSCLDVASLIYGFLRRWRIYCHLAHVSLFIT